MTFCYQREDNGEIVEMEFPIGQAPKTVSFKAYVAEGNNYFQHRRVTAVRSLTAEGPGFGGVKREDGIHNTGKNIWPMKSDALGCGPKQVPEFREVTKRYGVPTDFAKDGRAILTSEKHKRKLAKLRGCVA